jgi:hypothetical protein
MDLNRGKQITQNIIHEIPVTNVVIKAVETMAYYAQGFASLKFKNRHGVIFHDVNWIAGKDYNDHDETNDNDDDEYQQEAADDENEDKTKQIDQEEVDDLILDKREEGNPTTHNGNGAKPD